MTLRHVKKLPTANKVWDKLKNTYEKKGVVRIVKMLKDLISTKFENFKNEEEYLSSMLLTFENLKTFGLELPEKVVGIFMLLSLPEEFTPMIMGIDKLEGIKSENVQQRIMEQCRLLTHDVSERNSNSQDVRVLFSHANRGNRYSYIGQNYRGERGQHKNNNTSSSSNSDG